MRIRNQAMGGVAAVIGASLAAFWSAPPATAGNSVLVRYASPTGVASATCPQSEPCDIATAIGSAPANSHVILLPGTYGASSSLPTVADGGSDLLISGMAGKARPVIDSSAAVYGGLYINNGSRVTGLTINYTGTTQGLFVNTGSADHMIVHSSGAASRACTVNTTLSDSLCTNSSPSGSGLDVVLNNGSATFRNVTAIATGTGLYADGLLVDGDTGTINVAATNSIFKGSDQDVRIYPEDDGETDSVTLHSCDVAKTFFANLGPGLSTESINVDNTDIKAAPKFKAGYQEAAGSPTINRGAPVPAGDVDLADHPRLLGSKVDMGAYEFQQKALVAHVSFSKKKPTKVKVAASVNPEGLSTKVHVVATHGRVSISSRTLSAGKGRSTRKLSFGLTQLDPNTTYSIRVVAINAGGTSKSPAKKLKTPKH